MQRPEGGSWLMTSRPCGSRISGSMPKPLANARSIAVQLFFSSGTFQKPRWARICIGSPISRAPREPESSLAMDPFTRVHWLPVIAMEAQVASCVRAEAVEEDSDVAIARAELQQALF